MLDCGLSGLSPLREGRAPAEPLGAASLTAPQRRPRSLRCRPPDASPPRAEGCRGAAAAESAAACGLLAATAETAGRDGDGLAKLRRWCFRAGGREARVARQGAPCARRGSGGDRLLPVVPADAADEVSPRRPERRSSAGASADSAREGVTFSFRDVQCSVPHVGPDGKKQRKTILRPISGSIPPGSVVGIMGPSGSGKTTLLDVLANKKLPSAYTGDVFVDGKKRDDKSFKALSIYAPQENIFNGNEEVWEVLDFAASLKSGRSAEDRKKLVAATLSFLGLDRVAKQRVGNTVVRGISGGQKRRLMIGRALVTHASLAFCDEPTSGLSSTDAESLMIGIREVAKACQVSFLVVIHQPRVEVFEMFDAFILLASGRCLYNGTKAHMEAYFSQLGYPLPPYVNPAEFYMELTSSEETVEKLATAYASRRASLASKGLSTPRLSSQGEAAVSSPRGSAGGLGGVLLAPEDAEPNGARGGRGGKARTRVEPAQGDGNLKGAVEDVAAEPRRLTIASSFAGTHALVRALHQEPGFKHALPRFLGQFWILARRSFTLAWRDRNALLMMAGNALLVAILTAVLFSKVYQEKAIMYQLSSLVLLSLSLASIPAVNMTLYMEKKITYLYETSDGFYSAAPYLLAEMTTGFLLLFGATFLALAIVIPCCAFPASKFGPILLLFMLFLLVVDAVMQCGAAVCPTYMMANTFAGGWLALFSVVNGYNANPKSVPVWLTWLVYLSPFYYLLDGVAIILYWDNADIFGSPEKAAKFGYASCEELLEAYGFAGTASGSRLTPPQWLWSVDMLVLLLMTVAIKASACLYQAYFGRLRR
ncbi:ATP-binding cassette G family transporter ABCG87 [Besnoitia besnoiti]|uniref:ATP-binding cassette G family transporter ABCG87 n=1 Tax=Besnoitia besnoiti TaxID=94643 RepID=A0A2A9MAB3_BESBE|nr:ATP-binding cassette G family transporter ABCG87 [Besnoitia besnoiti]PFH32876.1 ATP-binding cassette G family transporter ABCG87 [Besnoitia besnoiti]